MIKSQKAHNEVPWEATSIRKTLISATSRPTVITPAPCEHMQCLLQSKKPVASSSLLISLTCLSVDLSEIPSTKSRLQTHLTTPLLGPCYDPPGSLAWINGCRVFPPGLLPHSSLDSVFLHRSQRTLKQMSVIPGFGKLRQEDGKFQVSPHYKVGPCLKTNLTTLRHFKKSRSLFKG